MPRTLICPSCQTEVPLDDASSAEARCPRCQTLVSRATQVEEEPILDALPAATRTCPHCDQPNPVAAKTCRACGRWLVVDDEDEDDAPRYKPCPRCGARGADRVVWTAWGSFYGPVVFTHVRCPRCSYGYNGRTGGSNLIPAIGCVVVPLLGIIAILGGLAFAIMRFYR